MPKFHRHGPGFSRHGGSYNGAIWLIGLGILAFTGHWWPGILLLVGISMVFGTLWREPEAPSQPPVMPMQPPMPAPVAQRMPAPAPSVSSTQRIDLLPATCPRCGAPVRSNDVKWRGEQFAACAYCGSNVLPPNNKKL